MDKRQFFAEKAISLTKINRQLIESFYGRKTPNHKMEDRFTAGTVVFLTVCTKDRNKWLASENAMRFLLNAWESADHWQVGHFLLMPDHLHLFARKVANMKLGDWVKFWKSHFSRHVEKLDWRWQAGYWDKLVHDSEDHSSILRYMLQNPIRANLVKISKDWGYQGEMNKF